jgi:hypothetical protein
MMIQKSLTKSTPLRYPGINEAYWEATAVSTFAVETNDLMSASVKIEAMSSSLASVDIGSVLENIANAMRGSQTASSGVGAARTAAASMKTLASRCDGLATSLRMAGVDYEATDVSVMGK